MVGIEFRKVGGGFPKETLSRGLKLLCLGLSWLSSG